MKKLVILKHGGGELGNQLWNYISIYAYGLETGAKVRNPSFFEYHSFFRFLQHESLMTRLFSLFFQRPRRRSHPLNRLGRMKYAFFSSAQARLHRDCTFSSQNNINQTTNLPPTEPLPPQFESCNTLYFTGWLFRNSLGLEKHRNELIAAFAPVEKIEKRIKDIMDPMRRNYEKIIGVHVRQSDYADFKGGKYLVSQEVVRKSIDAYIQRNSLDPAKTLFFIASDGSIDENVYGGLNIHISKENSVTDLFLLSKTDAILGSHSTFNGFAAWYGGISRFFFDDLANP